VVEEGRDWVGEGRYKNWVGRKESGGGGGLRRRQRVGRGVAREGEEEEKGEGVGYEVRSSGYSNVGYWPD
jgi:hypothetical protein